MLNRPLFPVALSRLARLRAGLILIMVLSMFTGCVPPVNVVNDPDVTTFDTNMPSSDSVSPPDVTVPDKGTMLNCGEKTQSESYTLRLCVGTSGPTGQTQSDHYTLRLGSGFTTNL